MFVGDVDFVNAYITSLSLLLSHRHLVFRSPVRYDCIGRFVVNINTARVFNDWIVEMNM